MGKDDHKSQEQINEIQVEILQNTATIDERTKKMEEEIKDLRERYVAETVNRESRISAVETRTEQHDVIISGTAAVFLVFLTALFTHFTGILAMVSVLW